MRQVLWIGCAALTATALAAPAQAATEVPDRDIVPKPYWHVDFTIDVTESFDSGYDEFVGNTYEGWIKYDVDFHPESPDFSGSFAPEDGLLATKFEFDGQTYRETDDVGYEEFPLLEFTNGTLAGLDFFAVEEGGDVEIEIFHGLFGVWDYRTDAPGGFVLDGVVDYSDPIYVPVPAAGWAGLTLMGLVVGGRALKRRLR